MKAPTLSLFALPVLVTSLAAPPRARACENAVTYEVNPAVKQLTASEADLRAGRVAVAAAGIRKLFRGLRADPRLPGDPRGGIDPKASHAAQLLAVAVVRADGLLEVDAGFPAGTAEQRRGNLAWAIGILRAYEKLNHAPWSECALAEGLAKLPESRAEAKTILDRLAAKDLVTSAPAYLALADLRDEADDTEGARVARGHAAKMAPSSAPY